MLASTSSRYPASGESRIARASSSCSAWEKRSIATQSAGVAPSQMMRISEGPAIMSIPTTPNTCLFAEATYAFPGPTILSTRGMLDVPKARAAIACAPPKAITLSTPARAAAARTSGFRPPPGVGLIISSSFTPATFAGMAFISTDEG